MTGRKARRDTMMGIGVLGGISLLIMLTGASALSGTGVGKSLPEISMMFNELLGPQSMRFFCMGILAAAFSSLFVNPLIGGTVLADGLGKDCRVSGNWTKGATIAGMLLGMAVAILGSMGKMETPSFNSYSTGDHCGWCSIYRLGYAQADQRVEV